MNHGLRCENDVSDTWVTETNCRYSSYSCSVLSYQITMLWLRSEQLRSSSPCWAPAAPSWAWTQWGRGPRWTAQLVTGSTALCRCWGVSASAAGCPRLSLTHTPHSYSAPATPNQAWKHFNESLLCWVRAVNALYPLSQPSAAACLGMLLNIVW